MDSRSSTVSRSISACIVDKVHCNSGRLVDLLCILVDIFIHSSGPFGGPFFVWGGGGGGSTEPREPPMAMALYSMHIHSARFHANLYTFDQVFLDEINTSSCLGLIKEIIVDRSFDGEVIIILPHYACENSTCSTYTVPSPLCHTLRLECLALATLSSLRLPI